MSKQGNAEKKFSVITLVLFIVAIVFFVAMIGVVYINKKESSASASPNALVQLKINGTVLPSPRVIADFNMAATNGTTFTKQILMGLWSLMFFGFTNCAFVCPVTLAEVNKMLIILQKDLPANEVPQVVMVSVDPDRDTIPRFTSYLAQFNKSFIGLRGSMEQLNALAAQMDVTFSKIVSSDGNPAHYTITHSAEVMLLDPNGNLRAFFSYPHQGAEMAQDYEHIVKAAKNA